MPEAEAQMFWHTMRVGLGFKDDVKSEWVKADKDGSFKWTLIKGFQPSIQQLKKTGYEFIMEKSGPYFHSNPDGHQMIYSTSHDKPLVLFMRKKGEPTFVLKREMTRFDIKLDGRVARFKDILPVPNQTVLDSLAKANAQGIRQIGFGARAEYSTNDVTYRLTFIAPEGGGVISRDEILNEAPAEGYLQETTATFHALKHGQQVFFSEKPLWLFIKTAVPEVYARLKLDVKLTWGDPVVYVESVINPYGERNFEEEPTLDYAVRKQLEKEARINLCQNKRPSKPDLPKLIKETKEKAEKAKSAKPK